MILILVEGTDAFTVNDKDFEWGLSTLLVNMNRFVPDPETLIKNKLIPQILTYLGTRINRGPNSESAGICFVQDNAVQEE